MLHQLKSGDWVDPKQVSSVYVGWEPSHADDTTEMPVVNVVVDGAVINAIPQGDIDGGKMSVINVTN